jgi:hypothetical protein
MRLDWHGLATYVVVALDYIERNRRLRMHMCSNRWWCKCPQRWCKCVLQVQLLMQVHLLLQVQVAVPM